MKDYLYHNSAGILILVASVIILVGTILEKML